MKKQMFQVLLALIILLISVSLVSAQRQYTENSPLWVAYMGDHKISNKVGIHLEYQERRNQIGVKNQQHLFRTAINYHTLPNLFFSFGYAFVRTYPYGNFAIKSIFPEHRIYQQMQFVAPLQNVEAVTRFRLEQRFLFLPIQLTNGEFEAASKSTYTNRLRCAQRFSLPLKGKTILDRTIYATAFDELFINFGSNVQNNIFDQNRAFVGLGYKLPNIGRLEGGYLNQLLVKSDGIKIENNHTLSLALYANFDWR